MEYQQILEEQFNNVMERFLTSTLTDQPMILEIFTDTDSETIALKIMEELIVDNGLLLKNKTKEAVKSVVGEKGKNIIKSIFK